mmetsp:Transcript_44471/g.96742  ORF Transcript_44471/g.96742 Transcript_44471/m.96742 type:complete len:268 (-) Transcript_44471:806-1609(-)
MGGALPSAPYIGGGTTGGALAMAPAGTRANDRSGTGGGAGAFGAAAAWAAPASSRAKVPPPRAPPVRALAGTPPTPPGPPPAPPTGRGTSIDITVPNFSASRRMSPQISAYAVSSDKSSMVTMFFRYITLLGITRAPSFCSRATSPISITSSGFFTLSRLDPSSRPSNAARACCCVIISAYSKNATPTDLPSSSFCNAKNFSCPKVMSSSRIRSSVTNVGILMRHSLWSMAETMAPPAPPGRASIPLCMPRCAIMSPSAPPGPGRAS